MAVSSSVGETDAHKRRAAAEYIALEGSRLARAANSNGFALLAYLIDMAVLKAWREASEGGSENGAWQEAD